MAAEPVRAAWADDRAKRRRGRESRRGRWGGCLSPWVGSLLLLDGGRLHPLKKGGRGRSEGRGGSEGGASSARGREGQRPEGRWEWDEAETGLGQRNGSAVEREALAREEEGGSRGIVARSCGIGVCC